MAFTFQKLKKFCSSLFKINFWKNIYFEDVLLIRLYKLVFNQNFHFLIMEITFCCVGG